MEFANDSCIFHDFIQNLSLKTGEIPEMDFLLQDLFTRNNKRLVVMMFAVSWRIKIHVIFPGGVYCHTFRFQSC